MSVFSVRSSGAAVGRTQRTYWVRGSEGWALTIDPDTNVQVVHGFFPDDDDDNDPVFPDAVEKLELLVLSAQQNSIVVYADIWTGLLMGGNRVTNLCLHVSWFIDFGI
ncbi:unnamed protein product [Enterobius vermicularis]|uniref:Uncharacterized protein n=1 Tax=Enterobius vermicularis TaxID=51028 RepID=A0A0N4V4G3_ENTVE|nr:unnamed protein product [Enterobius vermicularis]